MPKEAFATERNGPKRLRIEWKGIFREASIYWDDALVGEYVKDELLGGVDVTPEDGPAMTVALAKTGMFSNGVALKVRFADGTPVPGSDDDPEEAGKQAGYFLYFLAGINALCGVVAMATENATLVGAGAGIGSLVVAVVYGGLGLFTMRGSRLALGIAIAIYLLDFLAGVAMGLSAGGSPSMGGLFMRIFITVALVGFFKKMGAPSSEGPGTR